MKKKRRKWKRRKWSIGKWVEKHPRSFNRTKKEKTFEREVINSIEQLCKENKLKLFHRKIHGSMYGSGLPDDILIINGIHYWFEFKRVGGKLSGVQKATISSIKQAGGNAYAIVGVSRKEMQVLSPPKWNVKFTLRKTNSHWDGLYELLNIPKEEKVDISI